ncbi:hypothetical protein BC943DRAFT_325978, partial [Umbelopsis sp. AD052]
MFVNHFVPQSNQFLLFLRIFVIGIFVGGQTPFKDVRPTVDLVCFWLFLEQKKIVYVIAICVKYIVFVELLEIEDVEFFFFFF